jgi:uncharacterized RDD family membrane protein YckC
MRCPKCQYISFDSGDRCRNCGYDFSLTTDVETPDLPIQNGTEPLGPYSELNLREPNAPLDTFASESAARNAETAPRPITSSFDLPLFKERAAGQDAPLVIPSEPRAPLAVRRAAPVPRPRPRRGAAADELENTEPRLALDTAELPAVPGRAAGIASENQILPASIVARILAGLIDLVIIGGIDLVVIYFTLKICELTFAEWTALPLAPLVAFLLLLDGAYFAIFIAAGGQTIGKMATGIRVIPMASAGHPARRVPLGHAILRAGAYLVSALPAGLGFIPGLFGSDRRALHDRLADTRVVKA